MVNGVYLKKTNIMKHKRVDNQIKEPIGFPIPEKPSEIEPLLDPIAPKIYPEENPIENPQQEPTENPPYQLPKPTEFP